MVINQNVETTMKHMSFCTFSADNLNKIIKVFQSERNRATVELKEHFLKAAKEKRESPNKIVTTKNQWLDKLMTELYKAEKENELTDIEVGMFEEYVTLNFMITTTDKQKYADKDWHKLLISFSKTIATITITMSCPLLKKEIIFSIKEDHTITGGLFNNYEIKGTDMKWVDEVEETFNNIIVECKNHREKFYGKESVCELIGSLILTGALFFSLGLSLMYILKDIGVISSSFAGLIGIGLFVVLWLPSIAISNKLSGYIKNLYPSVEIFLSEVRPQQRKQLSYVSFVITIPYIIGIVLKII